MTRQLEPSQRCQQCSAVVIGMWTRAGGLKVDDRLCQKPKGSATSGRQFLNIQVVAGKGQGVNLPRNVEDKNKHQDEDASRVVEG